MMAMISSTTDVSLLETLWGGRNQRAWHEFFQTYSPLLMIFARRLGLSDADASDAVQETLLAVYGAFRDMPAPFDRSKGRFKHWLRGVAAHKVRDVQRRRARAGRLQAPRAVEENDAVAERPDVDGVFEAEWQRNLLARALALVAREVDPAVFQAFELYVIHEQPADKVARLLSTTRNAVYISKTRVLRRLRVVLSGLTEAEG